MKKVYFLFFASLFTTILLVFVSFVYAEEDEEDMEGKTFLFKLKDGGGEISLSEYREMNIETVSENLEIYKADYDTVEYLKESGLIEYAEENSTIELADLDMEESEYEYNDQYFEKQWYFEKHAISDAKKTLGKGGGVRIAVVDSGVTIQEDFDESKIEEGYNYINTDKTGNYLSESDDISVRNHGTSVASVICSKSGNGIGIAGIAEESVIVPLIIYQDGVNTIDNVITAISDAVEKYGCDVINLSLTSGEKSKLLQEAVDYAYENNVIVVAAAGNKGGKSYLYPASCENVISVGSIGSSFEPSYFSQRNDYVDISAAGDKLTVVGCGGNYYENSGTSFSSPIIAGFAALIKEKYPDINGETFLNILKAGSYDTQSVGYDNYTGFGVFNAMESLEFAADGGGCFISPVYIDGENMMIKVFGKDISGNLIFAVYDEKGKMKDFSVKYFETDRDIFCMSKEYALDEGDFIKIFTFNDFNDMRPLAKARRFIK